MLENQNVSVRTLVAVSLFFAGLLSTATVFSFKIALSMGRIEARLERLEERLQDDVLSEKFYTRVEASIHHQDLLKTLRESGVVMKEPPPYDPIRRMTR